MQQQKQHQPDSARPLWRIGARFPLAKLGGREKLNTLAGIPPWSRKRLE
jgi:hypothetical protein